VGNWRVGLWNLIEPKWKRSKMVHIYNSSTQGAQTGGLRFEVSLCYGVRPCL
jgi:hypothetical protein